MGIERQMRASIYTLGCRLNHGESAQIVQMLERAGYSIVPFGESSDLGVIHTCIVTAEAGAKSRKMIRGYIRRNPDAFVAVVGCYAQVMASDLASIAGVDLILGNARKLDLLSFIKLEKNPSPVIRCDPPERGDFVMSVCPGKHSEHRPNLKIQDGCDCRCSYCIVPFARGPSRSREFGNILEEARLLAESGVKEVVLSGVNVGDYHSADRGLVDVIDALDEIAGLTRIRLGSVELGGFPLELLERMKDPAHRLVPFLHVPLQSGSNRVLQQMNRPQAAEQFLQFTAEAVNAVPDMCIGVDVLVGFPGETADDFRATVALLREAAIAYTHVFQYSPRPGTKAAGMPGRVDPQTAQARSEEVRHLGAEKRAAFHGKFMGKTLEVLLEEQVKGRWEGYTGNYIRVAAFGGGVESPASESSAGNVSQASACCHGSLANRLMPVRIERDEGEMVAGTLERGTVNGF